MATHVMMSAEQFDRLPAEEGLKYELLDGELIGAGNPSPGHQYIADTLLVSIRLYLDESALGVAIRSSWFAIGAQGRLRPDVAVLLPDKWKRLDREKSPVDVVPDVVIEVISPTESANDVDRKTKAYLEGGVGEVIIVHPDTGHIDVVSKAGASHYLAGETLTSRVIPGWSISVDQVFGIIK